MPDISALLPKMNFSLSKLVTAANSYAKETDKITPSGTPIGQLQYIARRALEECRPMIRGMLQKNLERSGIHRRSGKLAKAIDGCIIGASFDHNKPWRIYVRYQPDIEPYVYYPKTSRGKKTESVFYTVAASLNHGSVTSRSGSKELSKRRKVGIKQRAAVSGKDRYRSKGKSYQIRPARPFFFLDGGQQARIVSEFLVIVHRKMATLMRLKRKV
jgi:hypothetical protein